MHATVVFYSRSYDRLRLTNRWRNLPGASTVNSPFFHSFFTRFSFIMHFFVCIVNTCPTYVRWDNNSAEKGMRATTLHLLSYPSSGFWYMIEKKESKNSVPVGCVFPTYIFNIQTIKNFSRKDFFYKKNFRFFIRRRNEKCFSWRLVLKLVFQNFYIIISTKLIEKKVHIIISHLSDGSLSCQVHFCQKIYDNLWNLIAYVKSAYIVAWR